METADFFIYGMRCNTCTDKIKDKLYRTNGISDVKLSLEDKSAKILFDVKKIDIEKIFEIIDDLGFSASITKKKQDLIINFVIFFVVAVIFFILKHVGVLNIFADFSAVDSGVSFGMLFLIGLATSVHCVAMCGGINMSQCLSKDDAVVPSLLYNAGRVISYTAVGAVVGAIGSIIVFTGNFRVIFMIIAGIFMIIAGINIGGGFSWTQKFRISFPKIFKSDAKSPLVIGLINGFMPCGPLQSMQLYALYTSNALSGAAAMFLFSMGTVPLMFALGVASTALSRKFTETAIKIGSILVVFLGLLMVSNGLSLLGVSTLALGSVSSGAATLNSGDNDVTPIPNGEVENSVQIIRSRLKAYEYPAITVKEGIPVRWIIDAEKGDINGCNNRIFISEYGIEYMFKFGENIIEFTPKRSGVFVYSCWMGMMKSTISVVKNGEAQ